MCSGNLYLAKMVGGNSALLVEVDLGEYHNFRLVCSNRIKCKWVLNLSILKCVVKLTKYIPFFCKGEQYIDFVYLTDILEIVKESGKTDEEAKKIVKEIEKIVVEKIAKVKLVREIKKETEQLINNIDPDLIDFIERL